MATGKGVFTPHTHTQSLLGLTSPDAFVKTTLAAVFEGVTARPAMMPATPSAIGRATQALYTSTYLMHVPKLMRP